MKSYRYDVFISFRGIDTRNTFVDHLYSHLIRKGIFAFKDDQRLQKGELISPQLEQAIRDSRVSVIVFSQHYASSSWCLDEMAAIAHCHQQFKQTVFPVFYDVDLSHVRKQNGVYEDAFALHTLKFKQDPDKVDRWKRAMTNLGNSVGWDVRDKPEFKEIDNIAKAIIRALGHKFSGFADDLVGIQPRVKTLENLLKLTSKDDGIQVLGIWGMNGIGKTTHATVLYNRISHQFNACCFIENVSKIYKDGDAVAVQRQILRQTLDEKNLDAYGPLEICGIIRNRLHHIKVLIVLDNVEDVHQLEKLAINPKLLHTESRMIITTRDKHILKVYGAQAIYEVPLLSEKDARELFCEKAFKSPPSSSCMEMIPEILTYAQSLPLALKVLGSFLCTRDADQWRGALNRLKENPDDRIMEVLKISFDGLSRKEKDIFLHIACFFKGERKDYVKRILDSCGLLYNIGILIMVEKSMITIKNEEIHMHQMLQELGKKIVDDQCVDNPAERSRLWRYMDLDDVFERNTERNKVEAIVLHQEENVSMWDAEGLSKMKNLKLLILYDNRFGGTLNFLSKRLHYLFWHGYPFASLPSTFNPFCLVELNMPDSAIERLWEGPKNMPLLKRVDLSNSKCLIETPNFEGSLNIKRLDLTGCTKLSRLHQSIGLLGNLTFLSLRNCTNLTSLDFGDDRVSNLGSLRVLHLSGCTKLESTPNFKVASKLEYLNMDGCTSLSTVHVSIGALTRLRFLSLRECTKLKCVPSEINTMVFLTTLDLFGCSDLMTFNLKQERDAELTNKAQILPPRSKTRNSSSHMKALIFLDLSFCNLMKFPDAIGELMCLERLNLQGNKFCSIPNTISKLSCLAYLNLAHCRLLEYLPVLPTKSASSVGRYFLTASGSRDHRSGFYVFDCLTVFHSTFKRYQLPWLRRLLKEPRHFRCGFDIISRCVDTKFGKIPPWFNHRFGGDSIIRIGHCNEDDDWIGFAFCVAFQKNNRSTSSSHHSTSFPLPHPFYLSFESECTEERFDMPLNLELAKINGSEHLWIIFISRKHCHFVKTEALITFKACPGLVVKEWGLRRVVKKDIEKNEDVEENEMRQEIHEGRCSSSSLPVLIIGNVKKDSSFGPKIQLPYNWLVTEEDEIENFEAKAKENTLSIMGLEIGQSQ
ncbi:TMV resistance protein N-like [Abrus precatorius]|uniref:TMV resistance protein N-like n=1 Tax=Abrus precatorius TaxID=3816 RepID=A0A8B8KHQ3_ABRPR|nr:TMV resistance protein N-like [Abrus precatorius]